MQSATSAPNTIMGEEVYRDIGALRAEVMHAINNHQEEVEVDLHRIQTRQVALLVDDVMNKWEELIDESRPQRIRFIPGAATICCSSR